MATLDSNQVRGTTRNHTVRREYVKEESNLYQCSAAQSSQHYLVFNLTYLLYYTKFKLSTISFKLNKAMFEPGLDKVSTLLLKQSRFIK